jgi:6-pyruvoyltetrahydropterin/6-carboxytetrahydropterin synthase
MGFQVTRYHDICAGHRVVGHEGKCRNLHGHNYRITFTVAATRGWAGDQLDDVGRVLDFSIIKSKLCMWLEESWDHRMLLWEQDPLLKQLQELDSTIVAVPFNPTAENIAQYLVTVVAPRELERTGAMLISAEVEETRKCAATYEVSR